MRFYIYEIGEPGFIRGVVAVSEHAVREMHDERFGGRQGIQELSAGFWGSNTEAMTREELLAFSFGKAALEAWENDDDRALDLEEAAMAAELRDDDALWRAGSVARPDLRRRFDEAMGAQPPAWGEAGDLEDEIKAAGASAVGS